MLTLDEIGQSVRNDIQLITDHVGLPLAVGPLSDDDYKILRGGYGGPERDYALSTYDNSREKYEFCIKLVQQGRVQGIPSGATVCIHGVKENISHIHVIERSSREDKSHPLRGHMVLLTLVSTFIFCKAIEYKVVHTIGPVPELVQYRESFGFHMEQRGYAIFVVIDELQDVFLKFAQQVWTRRGYKLWGARPDYLKGTSMTVVLCLNY